MNFRLITGSNPIIIPVNSTGKDNNVQFEGLSLQVPKDQHRYHYVKARIKVSRHLDGSLSIDHGPRRLGRYTADGLLIQNKEIKSQAA
ncbi:MAG: hypothetical protein ACI9FD_005028 [Gammaproteobacteria bacterium]|jgi:hypothetical protein